jgi:hypothetical protein
MIGMSGKKNWIVAFAAAVSFAFVSPVSGVTGTN